ncbi:hypothetical protein Tco_1270552, partial [Tanacetum coccineum]
TVMSDSKDSTITYTAVSSPFGGLSDIGSPGPGPEYPPSPDFIPEPVYPEFMPPEDEVLPAEEQPLPVAVSPTADSPGYVPESDPEEDPEEDDDDDPEEDPADYSADGGDDGHDEDESSDDDEDDVDIEEDDKEEEHPAPVDSTAVALPAVDHALSAEETEPFETDESAATPPPHPAYRVTARISIRDELPTPFWSDTKIPSPPLPPILSPLPISPPLHVSSLPPASPTYPLSGKEPRHRLLPIHHRHISYYPTPEQIHLHQGHHHSYPYGYLLHHHLPSVDHGANRPEVCLPPQKRLCFAFGPRYEVGESSSAAAARPTGGFRQTMDEMLVDMPGAPATNDTELGRRMTEFATRVRQDTDEIYVRLDDEQTERQLMADRLNMLYRDRCAHARTTLLIEKEARMSREDWGRSMDASDLAHSRVPPRVMHCVLCIGSAGSDYRVAGSGPQETGGDYRVASSRPQEIGTVH